MHVIATVARLRSTGRSGAVAAVAAAAMVQSPLYDNEKATEEATRAIDGPEQVADKDTRQNLSQCLPTAAGLHVQ